jgi:hypothetical protein
VTVFPGVALLKALNRFALGVHDAVAVNGIRIARAQWFRCGREVSGELIQTINARDLHGGVGIGKDFSVLRHARYGQELCVVENNDRGHF